MMRQNEFEAFILTDCDPHISEYVAPRWKARTYFSGFDGSAGTLVITLKEAGLWTDSRYFLQAAKQLEGTGITLYKEGLPDTISLIDFLATRVQPGCIGSDPSMLPTRFFEEHAEWLQAHERFLDYCNDPFRDIWTDRPERPMNKAYIYKVEYAGQSCAEKLELLRQCLEEQQKDALLLAALDEIGEKFPLR